MDVSLRPLFDAILEAPEDDAPRLAREVMDSAKSMLLRSTTAAPKPELRTSIRFATTFATFDA